MNTISFETDSGAAVLASSDKHGVRLSVLGMTLGVAGGIQHNGKLAIDARAMPKMATITGPEDSIRAVLALKAAYDAARSAIYAANIEFDACHDSIIAAMAG